MKSREWSSDASKAISEKVGKRLQSLVAVGALPWNNDSKPLHAILHLPAADPGPTLQNLGYDVSENYIRVLIDAIQGKQSSFDGSDVAEVWLLWAAVRQEHIRQ